LVLKSLAVSGMLGVLVMIVIASLFEAVYYFKLAGYMFSKGERRGALHVGFIQKSVFALLVILLIVIGVAPFILSGFLGEASRVMLDSANYITVILGG
jgi:multicomponent Na+:H+ antiporter subunit D